LKNVGDKELQPSSLCLLQRLLQQPS